MVSDAIEPLPSSNNPLPSSPGISGPWPWYVLIIIGMAFGGYFPWMMISWALYQKNEKKVALTVFFANLVLLGLLGWMFWSVCWPWWYLTSFEYIFYLLWSASAVYFQSKVLGPAPPRYDVSEWRSWIPFLLIGLIIGVCIGIICSVGSAFEKKQAMMETMETLDRQSILWDLFQNASLGGFLGLLLGMGWAGQKKKVSAGQIVACLFGLILVMPIWAVLYFLFLFIIHNGTMPTGYLDSWYLIPPWVSGFQGGLLKLGYLEFLTYIVLMLFFADVKSMSHFWKRSLIIPLLFILFFPLSFSSEEWWQTYQEFIYYEMTSPDPDTRAYAHERAQTLLARYPDHARWPEFAERMTRYFYEQGDFEKAKTYCQKIVDRYDGSHQWHWTVQMAKGALASPAFGKPEAIFRLDVPVVDYEDYLTHNWMALLSVIRYHKGPNVPESQVTIELKALSNSDDKISLSPLDAMADIDDAARNLGYETLFLPADVSDVQHLLQAGFPILHSNYGTFNVIYGWDKGRDVLNTYVFYQLSTRTREERRKKAEDIEDIVLFGEDDPKTNHKRLHRIAAEVTDDYVLGYWQGPALRYSGPLIAVVFPSEKADRIAAALEKSHALLRKESNGYLAALIAESCLKDADPINALTWAKTAANLVSDPLPLYEAHMVKIWWERREQKLLNKIPLEQQFKPLANITAFFEDPENTAFLKQAGRRFEKDLNKSILPWGVLHRYLSLLDRSKPDDQVKMIAVAKKELAVNPSYSDKWRFLADVCELRNDIPGTIAALEGAISCNPADYQSKLRAAYFSVVAGDVAKAETLLKTVDVGEIQYDADYDFCLGAIAEWKGDTHAALHHYEKAISMRCYKPVYHLKYGRLLQKEGYADKAQKAIQWAADIEVNTVEHQSSLSDVET